MTERNGPDDDATQSFDPFADETTAVGGGHEQTRRMAPQPTNEPTATQRFGATPAPTPGSYTERIAVRQQRDPTPWLVALAIVVALAVGAALGYAQDGRSDDGVVARSLVGPNGGVMEFGKIGRLEVPADALPTATAITIRKVTNTNRIRVGADGDPRSSLYEPGELQMYAFEPADLRFQQPVKITIPRPNDGKALLIDTPDGARVVSVETDSDRAKLETDDFSFDG